jgi:hypothetical protein
LPIPVSGANVTSVISGYAAAVNDDSENHETKAGRDFHDTEDELDLIRLVSDLDRVLDWWPTSP